MTIMHVLPPTTIRVEVAAGKYVLGDPCYVVPDLDWQDLLKSCEYFEQPIGEIHGHQVLGFSTRWGDGTYADNQHRHYPVDAGLIGLVPIEYAIGIDPELSHVVEFKNSTTCIRTSDGILTFGDIVINTDSSYEE
jgi:hypothetical protein